LGDAIPWADDKVLLSVKILKYDLDLTRIIWIDNTSESVKTMLYGESRARCNTTISSWWEMY
jgi:hypothetical protein